MIKISIDRMARILGLQEPDTYFEKLCENPSDTYSVVFQDAVDEGFSSEEAEEKANAAEQKERDEAYNNYVGAVFSLFEREAENLNLAVTQLKTQPQYYAIMPATGWTSSAEKIRSVIHGVAGFWFTSFQEFLDSGPYTPRKAVEEHLGYLGDQWRLYGYASPSRRLSSMLG